jgi:hypothetical protein
VSAKDTNVGKDTEQAVARWLRGNGFAGAERLVRTGYRVATRESADEGDITGTPGITWQVKSLRPQTRAELAVPTWLNETEAQRKAAGSELGFLVVRRWGTTDVGRWWVFQHLSQLHQLACPEGDEVAEVYGVGNIPVRMDMAALSGLLVATGWADVSEEAS